MKKTALTSIAVLSIVAGTILPSNTALAKKHTVKHQSITRVSFKNWKLSGYAKAGSKVSVYHGRQKLGSTTIKRSHFTFKWNKLKNVKNDWKLTLTATKKGYKKTSKSVLVHVHYPKSTTTQSTSKQKAPSEFFSGNMLILKQGNIAFQNSVRESDGTDGTNLLVFFEYTNTTSKPVSIESLIYNVCDAKQNLGSVTRDLELGSVDMDSKYYDIAQAVDNFDEVNPGQTINSAVTWTLASPAAPVKIILTSSDDYTELGSLNY